MATDDALEISSRAMALLNADPVVQFDDGTNEAQLAAAFYEPTLVAALTEHRWNFACLQKQATKLVTPPSNKWALQYQLPANLLSLDNISPDTIQYELYAKQKLYTSYDGEIWVEGMFRVDETDMPPYFVEYFEYRLAAKFAFPISGDKSLAGAMESGAEKYKKLAKLADSKQRQGVGFKKNRLSLITARG